MNKLAQEQSDQPIINIHGELVALVPRHRDHIPLFLRWINDFAVTRTYGMRFRNRTLEAMQEKYEQGRSQIFREGATDEPCTVVERQSPPLPGR